MGGNALSQQTVRLAANEYQATVSDLERLWTETGIDRRHAVIPAYGTKPDFGDLDILVDNSNNYDPLDVARRLNATEVKQSGPVTSFGYVVPGGIFQVDLVGIRPDLFDYAYRYYAMNDLGNLLGRTARRVGMKLGHLGLFMTVKAPDSDVVELGEITLTTDWAAAIEFLGYDPLAYENGLAGDFRTLQDLFDFAISSRFVSQDVFLLENRNNAGRLRDRKRKTYMQFLDWLPTSDCPATSVDLGIGGEEERPLFKAAQRERAFDVFPHARTEYEHLLDLYDRRKRATAKFNGETVGRMTGLSGKPLGQLMDRIRAKFETKLAMYDFILAASQTELDALVLGCRAD